MPLIESPLSLRCDTPGCTSVSTRPDGQRHRFLRMARAMGWTLRFTGELDSPDWADVQSKWVCPKCRERGL
jgi:hypothetical protein